VADETEEEFSAFLRSRGRPASGDVWDTAERILVAVTGAPGDDVVIRRAARMAARMKADLLALHVVAGTPGGPSAPDHLEELVQDVGGR
jgi:two-component system sensor histidine kinase KdpD